MPLDKRLRIRFINFITFTIINIGRGENVLSKEVKTKMAELNFKENNVYVKSVDIEKPTIAQIIGAHKEYKKSYDGMEKTCYDLPLRIGNDNKLWTASITALKQLAEQIGSKNTDLWVGKNIRLEAMRVVIRGKVIKTLMADYLPIEEERIETEDEGITITKEEQNQFGIVQ